MLTALTAALQAMQFLYETYYYNLQQGEIARPSLSGRRARTDREPEGATTPGACPAWPPPLGRNGQRVAA